jgi:hypothetical protein
MEITYTIEVTKTNHPKSGYEKRYSGLNESVAEIYWRGINIGNGFKARMRNCVTGKIERRKA